MQEHRRRPEDPLALRHLEAVAGTLAPGTRVRVSTVQPHPCAVGAAALARMPRL